jgi:crotonobetainyl-CoA:carnitine CoA-transferase CaiB-like acyl-CoA transferase
VPPLDGTRVVDLTRLLPGAYATLLLVDLGAEVIKIEEPHGGDGMRRFGAHFDAVNRGKRSVTLDLRSPDAAGVLDALLSTADVIVDSFRPSTARRLGVDAETLRAKHPRLICASMTGFGHAGPHVETAAHDINYQALAGLLRPPARPGPLIADIGAGMQTAIRILAALIERGRSETGSVVDVPIFEAARQWAMFPTTGDLESACYTLYETADGEWLALGALEPKFWQRFCDGIGHPEFVPLQHARDADEIRAVVRSKTRDEWLTIFDGLDACLTTVLTPAETATGARGEQGPALGADTDTVLAAIGICEAERARLRSAGAI